MLFTFMLMLRLLLVAMLHVTDIVVALLVDGSVVVGKQAAICLAVYVYTYTPLQHHYAIGCGITRCTTKTLFCLTQITPHPPCLRRCRRRRSHLPLFSPLL